MYTETELKIIIDGWPNLMEAQRLLSQTRELPYQRAMFFSDDRREPWFSYKNQGGTTVKVSFTGTVYKVKAPEGATPIVEINS